MGRCAYQYVEVMACPSGCLNGGGQPKPRPGLGAGPQQLLEQVEAAYAHEVGDCVCGGGTLTRGGGVHV